MSEKKQPVDLGLLEEDDEFEEFPAEGAGRGRHGTGRDARTRQAAAWRRDVRGLGRPGGQNAAVGLGRRVCRLLDLGLGRALTCCYRR
uniref:Uncharacterized protein n=1 Tax=Catharus ustulatus TaxID=91951 RepID=A0A8C3TG68_CATUS